MSSDPAFDVMTPVELASGTTTWLKLGVAWPDDRGKYAMRISIASLPLGAFGKPSIELYLYPRGHIEKGPPRKWPRRAPVQEGEDLEPLDVNPGYDGGGL